MIVSQNPNRQNFTSVIPLKIIQNGEVVNDERIKSAAMRAVSKTLRGNDKNAMKAQILDEMAKYDSDFTDNFGALKKDVLMKRFRNHLLTDKHAENLESCGLEVVKAKSKAINYVSDADKFVDIGLQRVNNRLLQANRNFSRLMDELFNPNSKSRIRERFNTVSREYEGAPVELQIEVKKGKKMSLDVDSFSFQRVGTSPNRTLNKPSVEVITEAKPLSVEVENKPKVDSKGQYEMF